MPILPDSPPTPDQMAQALALSPQNQQNMLGQGNAMQAMANPMAQQAMGSMGGMLGAQPPGPPGMLTQRPPMGGTPTPPPPLPPQGMAPLMPPQGMPPPPMPAPSAPRPGIPGGANPYAIPQQPLGMGNSLLNQGVPTGGFQGGSGVSM